MTTRGVIAAILNSPPQPLPLAAATANPKLAPNFVASGAGVRTSVVIDKFSNTDVAPTIAKLLGIGILDVAGHALDSFQPLWSPNLSVSPSPNRPCPRR